MRPRLVTTGLLLAGFFAASLLAAGVVSAVTARQYNPHEFSSAFESVLFGFVVWGVVLPAASGTVMAMLVFPVASRRVISARPFLLGAACAIATFVLSAFGISKQLARAAHLPVRAQMIVPGVLVGSVVLLAAFLIESLPSFRRT